MLNSVAIGLTCYSVCVCVFVLRCRARITGAIACHNEVMSMSKFSLLNFSGCHCAGSGQAAAHPWSVKNVFMTQLTGIGIPGSQVSRIADVLQRTKGDVSELIDPPMGKTTVRGKLLASSSVPSICFGSRIAVQQSSAPLSPTPSAFLTAERLKRHDVGTNYVIKLK